MNLIPFRRLFSFLILFVLVIKSVSGQVEVKISKEKVSIDGVAYYIHIVQDGQTLYSISKTYHVSTETLMKENRSAVFGLKEGDPLKIPVVSFEDQEPENKERNTEKYIYHTLQEGETVFALSKKYNVPEDDIRESNPDVNVFDLPVGSEIAVPRKKFKEQPRYFRTDNEGFRLHKVRRGENLSDIAKAYDISVKQLRNANRRIIFPKTGEYLRIPSDQVSVDIESFVEAPELDSLMIEDENITLLFDGTSVDYTTVDDLDGTIDVALLLPLYLDKNRERTYIDSSSTYPNSGNKIYKTVKRPEEWIYMRSENFIEYYEGVLLAIDDLRSLGLSINLKVFDTAADPTLVDSLIHTGELRDVELIIGPVYSFNVSQVAKYARRHRIQVVSPLDGRNRDVLKESPYLFQVKPSQEVVEEAMAKLISEYADYNLVYVHSDTIMALDPYSSGFKNNIYRKLRYVVPIDEINFREVVFASRSAYNDTINIIDHALSKERPNLIIVASTEKSVMEEVIITVHSLLKDYKIEVLGYPEMRWLDNLDPIYFYDLRTMLFTPTWLDYNQEDVKRFITKYRAKFNMEPHVRSYAWQSYDIAYYFLSGISLHRQFKYQPGRHRPDLLQVDFDFSRIGLAYGFENNRLFLIRYTPEMSVEFPRFFENDYRE